MTRPVIANSPHSPPSALAARCTIVYHEFECELIRTICELLFSNESDHTQRSLSQYKTPPPDDPSFVSHQPSTSRFARPWFPAQSSSRDATSYQSGGIPTWETSIGGGSGAAEEAEAQIQNPWETRYSTRVDLLAAWAYVLGPVSGARRVTTLNCCHSIKRALMQRFAFLSWKLTMTLSDFTVRQFSHAYCTTIAQLDCS